MSDVMGLEQFADEKGIINLRELFNSLNDLDDYLIEHADDFMSTLDKRYLAQTDFLVELAEDEKIASENRVWAYQGILSLHGANSDYATEIRKIFSKSKSLSLRLIASLSKP